MQYDDIYPKGKIESRKDLHKFLKIESKKYKRKNIRFPFILITEDKVRIIV